MEEGEELNSVILDLVDKQIKTNKPPETRLTFERLLSMGFSEESTRNFIAGVLLSWIQEMFEMDSDPFDIEKYTQALDSLP